MSRRVIRTRTREFALRLILRGRAKSIIGKMATSASVEECEEYIEKHGIQGLLKECIAKICQEQPGNPYKWLSAYFSALDVKKVCQALSVYVCVGVVYYTTIVGREGLLKR